MIVNHLSRELELKHQYEDYSLVGLYKGVIHTKNNLVKKLA